MLRLQVFFSTIILLFCFLQITTETGEKTTEWSIVTGIMGYWLPTPTNNKQGNKKE